MKGGNKDKNDNDVFEKKSRGRKRKVDVVMK